MILRDSISFLRFSLIGNIQVILWTISFVYCLKYPLSYFSSRFYFRNVLGLLFRLKFLLLAPRFYVFLGSLNYGIFANLNPNQSHSSSFFFFFFLKHRVIQRHLSSIRPWAQLSISLFFCLFVLVPPLSIKRMVHSILQGRLFRC